MATFHRWNTVSFMALLAVPTGALAVQPPEQTLDDAPADEIVVEGQAQRGTTIAPFEAEVTLDESDIAAYGVSTLGELLEELLTEAGSSRGRDSGPPVVLINGRRVSGFRELGNYPVEAIQRVQILPEEAALTYGFSADQRIINFILKPNITVTATEIENDASEPGGTNQAEVSFQRLTVNGDQRFSVDAEGSWRSPLFESERDIIPTNGPGTGQFRTIIPDQEDISVGFTAARSSFANSLLTVSGSFDRSNSNGLLGLDDTSGEGLTIDQQTDTGRIGLSLASDLALTTWTFTSSLNHTQTETLTDIPSDDGLFLRDARSEQTQGDASFLVNTRYEGWDAGPIAITGQIAGNFVVLDTVVQEPDDETRTEADRQTLRTTGNIDIPLRAADFGGSLLSVNGNVEVEELSDVGTLTTFGYGATWRPNEKFRLILSATHEEGAPSLNALTSPTLITPEARVFDFATGENALATLITGGNPNLTTDNRTVFKIGAQLRPIDENDLRINIDYTRSDIEGEVRTFTLLTEEFENAFPDRVVRDDFGGLLSFDRRPVQVAETRQDVLRSTVSWGRRITPSTGRPAANGARPQARQPGAGQPPAGRPQRQGRPTPPGEQQGERPRRPAAGQRGEGQEGQQPRRQRPAGAGRPARSDDQGSAPPRTGGPRSGRPNAAPQNAGPPRRSGRPGRIRMSVTHQWTLTDEVLIADGLASFDFLNGSATGNNGGTPAHMVDLSVNRWNNGLGVSFNARYQTASSVTQTDGTLDFSDRLTARTRIGYEFNYWGAAVERYPLLKESRLTFGVRNIFDTLVEVTDANGDTPTAFQDDLLNPLGRVYTLEFRKRF